MRSQRGNALVLLLIAAVALGVEALALAARGTALLEVFLLVLVLTVPAIGRLSLARLGVILTWLASFTLPWNGLKVGGLKPGDLLVLAALISFLASDIRSELPRLPRWVTQLGFVIVLVAALHEMLPTDSFYLAQRSVIDAVGNPTIEVQGNLQVAFKFLVGILAIPFAFCFTCIHQRRGANWLAVAFAAGTAVSSLAAFSDGRGLTHIGRTFTNNVLDPSREGGLSDHPNFLAASCVLALPLALWFAAEPRRWQRIVGSGLTLSILLGVYASGSRGGTVALAFGAVGAMAAIPVYRRRLVPIVLATIASALLIFAILPSTGAALLKATRLAGGSTSAEGSNLVRAISGAQGVLDFHKSPIFGIGFQVAAEAQNVYVQELASGGVLIFTAMLIYVLGALVTSMRCLRADSLAGPVAVSIAAGAVLNFVGADLTDRFFYVPTALAVAVAFRQARQSGDDPPGLNAPGRVTGRLSTRSSP